MIYVRTILPIFFLPLGLTLLLVLAGLLLRRRALIWAALAVLWLASTPIISALGFRAVEGWAERRLSTDVPLADAIVVLSDGGRVVAPGPAAISESGDPDRFYGGMELFRAGKAPLLVFTGGWAPWEANAPLEGEILKKYAIAWGVPPERVITTGLVTNTADEAQAVATLLRERQTNAPRVLLVTSAFHMPRAQRLFEGTGLAVTPFPVDFQVSEAGVLSVIDFVPSAGALERTQTAVREVYGRLFYALTSF